MYLSKFDEEGRRETTVVSGIHFTDDAGKQAYLDDGYVEISNEDFKKLMDTMGGANGTGYIYDAVLGAVVDAPPYEPTAGEKAEIIYNNFLGAITQNNERVLTALAAGDEAAISVARAEKTAIISEYRSAQEAGDTAAVSPVVAKLCPFCGNELNSEGHCENENCVDYIRTQAQAPPTYKSFAEASVNEIFETLNAGKATEVFAVGDKKAITTTDNDNWTMEIIFVASNYIRIWVTRGDNNGILTTSKIFLGTYQYNLPSEKTLYINTTTIPNLISKLPDEWQNIGFTLPLPPYTGVYPKLYAGNTATNYWLNYHGYSNTHNTISSWGFVSSDGTYGSSSFSYNSECVSMGVILEARLEASNTSGNS